MAEELTLTGTATPTLVGAWELRANYIISLGKKDVEMAVKHAIKEAGPNGLIISPANMHAGVNIENLKWMVEATKKFGKD